MHTPRPPRFLIASIPVVLLAYTGALPAQAQPQRGEGPPIEPRAPGSASPDAGSLLATTLPPDFDLAPRSLPAEGSMLTPTPGELRILSTGDVLFRPDVRDGTLPTFVLLPSPRMIQIRSTLAQTEASSDEAVRVRGTLSGQVWTYRGRAFLSASTFAPIAEEPPPAPTPASVQAQTQSQAVPGSVTREAAHSDLEEAIKALEGMSSAPRVLSSVPANGGGSQPRPTMSSAPLLQDGTILTGRTARFVRMSDQAGRLGLAFDGDDTTPTQTGGTPTTDKLPSLPLLPCQTLERMEAVAAQHADARAFVVTVRVVSDGERNYLLPLFFRASMPSGITPGQ